MKSIAICALLVLSCACSGAKDQAVPLEPAPTSARRVTEFIQAYGQLGFRGLPDAAQAAALAPHLSARLNGLLRDALVGQQAYRTKFPSDKPPLVDGDIFSSLFEGATNGTVDNVDETACTARVRVTFTYEDPQTGKAIEVWQDRFVLLREAAQWRIDDVEYLGNWDFAMRGRLSSALAETASLAR